MSIIKINEDKLQLLYGELSSLQACVNDMQALDIKFDLRKFQTIEDCLINLKQLFNDVGQFGMHASCERLQVNLSDHLMSGKNLSLLECALITEWKSLMKAFIANVTNQHIADALVTNLSKEGWLYPIGNSEKEKLNDLLLGLNEDNALIKKSIIKADDHHVNDINLSHSNQQVDLDLSAEDKDSDHQMIDLDQMVTESQFSPSSELLDEIEKDLFTADDVIIINDISENQLVSLEEELFSPANDTQIELKADDLSDFEMQSAPNKINEFKDEELIFESAEDEKFSIDDLTQPNISALTLSSIEEKIFSIADERTEISADILDHTEFENNVSEDVLDSIENDLFSPKEEDDVAQTNVALPSDSNEVLDAIEDELFSPDTDTSLEEESLHHASSDSLLDSIENELFTPDNEEEFLSLTSEGIDSCLNISSQSEDELFLFDESITPPNDKLVVKGGHINDKDQEFEDVINDLFTASQELSEAPEKPNSLDELEIEHSAHKIINTIEDVDVSDNAIQPSQDSLRAEMQYADWSEEQKELLALIVVEVEDAIKQQEDIVKLFLENPTQENEIREFMSLYIEQVERMSSAAEMVGLHALQKTCEVIHGYLLQYDNKPIQQTVNAYQTILLWPQVIFDYLADIYSVDNQAAVIEYLSDVHWCIPIGDEQKNELRALFLSSTIYVDHNDDEKRKNVATDADVSVAIPTDVQPELLDGLLQELPAQTEEFSYAVQSLNDDDFLQRLEVAQRIAHTIKGAANTVGISGLAIITHNLEDILEALAKNKVKPTINLQSALVEGADCLEQITEYLLGGGVEPQDLVHTLQIILDWANYIDEFGPPVEDVKETLVANDESSRDKVISSKVEKKNNHLENAVNNNNEASLRIPAAMIDNLLMQSGENIIATSQMHDQVSQLLESLREVKSNRDHVQEISQNLEHLIDIQGVGGRYLNKVHNQKFDPLELDQYNELHTYSRRLIEATNDSVELVKQLEDKLTILDLLISDQVGAQKESQYDMLKTRMVQVDSIAARLKRGVRQAAKLCDKTVELEITGGETLVDNKILVNLIDPLMHLLRNAVDHGLESDAQRQALDKPLPSMINLEVLQDGDRMIVICRDDGQGLDIEKIHARAIEYKLIDAEQELDDDQVKQLILQHGFSTSAEVTQLSGRGVGLDVVSSQVKSMNGLVSVKSELNQGTSFELSMPVSLLSAHALLVELSIGSVAVSTVGIEEIIHLEKSDVVWGDSEPTYTTDDKVYGVVYIEQLLSLPLKNTDDNSSFYTALKMSGEDKIILVPTISNTREIVIKPFSKFLPRVAGLVGTTILGNGEICSVVDVRELLEYYAKTTSKDQPSVMDVEINQPKLTALIVEDSLSTRKSLAEFMRDLNYEVFTAKDGLEAIEVMSDHQPNIILSDLEMPRMNGLELTSHLRAKAETKDIPIIMLTSRTTEKHIQEAKSIGVNEYLTKPFREDILFEKVNQLAPVI